MCSELPPQPVEGGQVVVHSLGLHYGLTCAGSEGVPESIPILECSFGSPTLELQSFQETLHEMAYTYRLAGYGTPSTNIESLLIFSQPVTTDTVFFGRSVSCTTDFLKSKASNILVSP